ARGVVLVRMDGISVATQGSDLDVVVVEFLPPSLQLGWVVKQLLHRAVLVAGITTSSHLDRFRTHSCVFLYQLVGGQVRKCSIENANRDLAARWHRLRTTVALRTRCGYQRA